MKPKTPNKQAQSKQQKSSLRGPMIAAAALVAMSGIVWGALWYTSPVPSRSDDAESGTPKVAALVATLSPDLFTGKAREAYQVAKEIPEILQNMPCFCGCPRLGHKNNLYCFADQHGEECDMCMDIAIEAKSLHGMGTPVDEISKVIRAKFGPESRDSR
jgi:hypothetical protein